MVIHVLHDGIGEKRIAAIRSLLAEFPNAVLDSIVVGPDSLPPLPRRKKAICYATLFLARFIQAERVLCLDADILVQGDVRDLWNIPMNGNAVLMAAANATVPPPEYAETIFFDNRPPVDAPYFNAGILAVDLAAWKEHEAEFYAVVSEKSHLYYDCDQVPINYVLRGKVGTLPRTWNHCSQIRGAHHAKLIHFQGPHHPWRFAGDSKVFRLWRDFCRREVAPFMDDPSVGEALAAHSQKLPPLPEFWKSVPRFRFFPDAIWQSAGFARAIARRICGAQKRILVYLSPYDALGDSILALETVRRLRKRFSECRFEAVVPTCAHGLFRALGLFDAVWTHRQLSVRNDVPRRWSAGQWDLVISLRRNVDGRDVRWLRSFLPARIVGFSGDQCCEFLYRCSVRSEYRALLWKDCHLPNDLGNSSIHQLEAHRRLLSLLDVDVPVQVLRPRIPEGFADGTAWTSLPSGMPGRVYVCAPCGTASVRNYPPEKWLEVFRLLAPCTVLLTGTAKDADVIGSMAKAMPEGVRAVDLAGKTSLPQLCGILARASAVLALDSGPLHLAIACGRPVVGVTGLGHSGRFAPYPFDVETARFLTSPCVFSGCSWHCVCEQNQCIAAVSPQDIASAVAEVSQ